MDPALVARPGIEGGFWVSAPPFRGYAKPLSRTRATPHIHPVAALEKIASDLAYALDLPVPPVTLWERTTAPAGEPRHHAVSAPPFAQVVRWGDIAANPPLYAQIRGFAVPVMSAMLVLIRG